MGTRTRKSFDACANHATAVKANARDELHSPDMRLVWVQVPAPQFDGE